MKSPPACIDFAMEIEERDYQRWKELLATNKIAIEKKSTERGADRFTPATLPATSSN